MAPLTVDDDTLIEKDPQQLFPLIWDWDDDLPPGAQIITSTFFITAIRPSTTDTALTYDSASILSGNRSTQMRLLGGTLGQLYELTNRMTDNQNPQSGEDRSVRILIASK